MAYASKQRWKIEFAGKLPVCYTMATNEEAALIRACTKLLKEKRVTVSLWQPGGGSDDYVFDCDDTTKLDAKREKLLAQLKALDQRLGIDGGTDGSDNTGSE